MWWLLFCGVSWFYRRYNWPGLERLWLWLACRAAIEEGEDDEDDYDPDPMSVPWGFNL